MPSPRVIGLTGGIASGKSTVAAMFRDLGAAVVDADVIAREVVAAGQPALAEIAREFGDEMLTADGTLNRERLGDLVFSDETARRKLNGITHPRIAAASQAQIASHAAAGHSVVLYDAALLVENGLHRAMAGVVVVSAPEEVQLSRLMTRDRLSREQAQARIDSQLPLAEKLKVATHVIDNGGTLEATRSQVEQTWRELNDSERPTT